MRRLPGCSFPPRLLLGLLLTQAAPALACGSLVAPNGAVRLSRATTLVAWHDGVEHYMTAFSYQGDVSNLGWIVPLPAVPTKIEEGGAWTFQRLQRETHPCRKACSPPVRSKIRPPAQKCFSRCRSRRWILPCSRAAGKR